MSQKLPDSLRFSKDHEWIETKSDNVLKIGVSHFAVDQLGDIVHIELPKVGATFKSGDSFGTIESTKTVSDLYAPVGGKVVAVNDAVLKTPEMLQQDAYDKGWLVSFEVSNRSEIETLMDASSYRAHINE